MAARAVLTETRAGGASRSLDVAGALDDHLQPRRVFVYGLVRTDSVGWASAQTITAMVIAAVLLGAFLVIETRVAEAPLVPLGILRAPALAGANLAMLCVGGSMFAMWYFVSLYLQGVLGESPLMAGLAFLPAAIAVIIGAQVAARLVPRFGPRRLLLVSPLLIAAGLLWMSRVSATGSYAADILGPITLAALGLGLCFPPSTYAATAGVAPQGRGAGLGPDQRDPAGGRRHRPRRPGDDRRPRDRAVARGAHRLGRPPVHGPGGRVPARLLRGRSRGRRGEPVGPPHPRDPRMRVETGAPVTPEA